MNARYRIAAGSAAIWRWTSEIRGCAAFIAIGTVSVVRRPAAVRAVEDARYRPNHEPRQFRSQCQRQLATRCLAETALFDFLKPVSESKDKEIPTDARHITVVQPSPFETQLLKSEGTDGIELHLKAREAEFHRNQATGIFGPPRAVSGRRARLRR
jgi:hypothetical protein